MDFLSYAPCMPVSQPDSFNPFRVLHANASETFQKIFEAHSSAMQCGSGCSQCCHAEFSIFAGEATLILEWFLCLDLAEKKSILAIWEEKGKGCAFLKNQRCTIYEARPIICRTQGAPLRFTTETKKENLQQVDACPLNFKEGIPSQREAWFDLNRLTHLQVIAEDYCTKNGVISEEIKKLMNKENRVPLRKLQEFLLASVKG